LNFTSLVITFILKALNVKHSRPSQKAAGFAGDAARPVAQRAVRHRRGQADIAAAIAVPVFLVGIMTYITLALLLVFTNVYWFAEPPRRLRLKAKIRT